MYTEEDLKKISVHEAKMYNGDSDFRYDSRRQFHEAHYPPTEVPTSPRGRVYAKAVRYPDGRIGFLPP